MAIVVLVKGLEYWSSSIDSIMDACDQYLWVGLINYFSKFFNNITAFSTISEYYHAFMCEVIYNHSIMSASCENILQCIYIIVDNPDSSKHGIQQFEYPNKNWN